MTFDEVCEVAWKKVEDIANEPCGGEVAALRQLERIREIANAVCTGNGARLDELLAAGAELVSPGSEAGELPSGRPASRSRF